MKQIDLEPDQDLSKGNEPLSATAPGDWKWLDKQLDMIHGFLWRILDHTDGTRPSPLVPHLQRTNHLLSGIRSAAWVIAALLAALVFKAYL